MIKRALVASTALVALSSVAFAADLPVRSAPPVAVAPVFTWSGFYFGVNAGYAFSSDDIGITTTGNAANTISNVALNRRPGSLSYSLEGFTGGGQVGYNWQVGSIVFGVEADAAYMDLERTTTFVSTTIGASGVGDRSVFNQSLDYLGTVRGRLGFTFSRFMVYGTGGFAYGDVSTRADFFSNAVGTPLQFTGSRSEIETGYAVGGGVEYALAPGSFNFLTSNTVTFKTEYL